MTSEPPGPGDGTPAPAAPLVLIVDDDERNRKLAQDVLWRSGLRTIEAAGGRAALAHAHDRQPDVVLRHRRLPDRERRDVPR